MEPASIVAAADVAFEQDRELQGQAKTLVFIAHQAFREERHVFILLHRCCAIAVFESSSRPAEKRGGTRAVVCENGGIERAETTGAVDIAGASGNRAGAVWVDAWLRRQGSQTRGWDVELRAEVVFDRVQDGY